MADLSNRPPASPELLTVEEASDYTGHARWTLYKKSSAREIASYKLGKRLMFAKSDLDEYIASKRREAVRV